MRHVLTHWVSQPACLHLMTPLSELSRTNLHRHLFNASASCCRTLLCFGCPNSSRISKPILAPSAWFTTFKLDDIVPTSKFVAFTLPAFSLPFSVVLLFCSVGEYVCFIAMPKLNVNNMDSHCQWLMVLFVWLEHVPAQNPWNLAQNQSCPTYLAFHTLD